MKKQWKFFLIILLLLVLAGVIIILYVNNRSNTQGKTPKIESSDSSMSDGEVFKKVKVAILNEGIKPYWTQTDCIWYTVKKDEQYYTIEIREKHLDNDVCPGDPSTSPLSGIFRINNGSGSIEVSNEFGGGEYITLDKYAELESSITN